MEALAISDDPIIEAKRLAAELGHEITILFDRTRWVGHRYVNILEEAAGAARR